MALDRRHAVFGNQNDEAPARSTHRAHLVDRTPSAGSTVAMGYPKPNDARGILYYVVAAAAAALLIVDIVGDGPQVGNLVVMVLVVILVFLRPGGITGGR